MEDALSTGAFCGVFWLDNIDGKVSLNETICIAENTRDFGVFVTTNFKSSLYAKLTVSQARARPFQIRREFIVVMKATFSVQYLSTPLRQYLGTGIDLTKRLQKLAIRLVKGHWHFLYERQFVMLGLPSWSIAICAGICFGV